MDNMSAEITAAALLKHGSVALFGAIVHALNAHRNGQTKTMLDIITLTVISSFSGTMFSFAAFEAKYGIGVEQFLDYKALTGDSSDNLPGVPGVGPKTATQLLQDFKTLDGIS